MTTLPESGWPFWWRWVLATNAGWFPGIFLGLRIAQELPPSPPVWPATLAAAVAAALFGAGQAFVLRGVLAPRAWWSATLLGWPLGVATARLSIEGASLALPPIFDTIVVAGVAGTVVGFAQAWALRGHLAGWLWWPPISGVGWAALVPGAVPGVGLVWLARSQRRRRLR